jgi:nucleotide-binding universal stress UspA family protein
MSNVTRILVPTDFSEPADAALDYAVELSKTVGAQISLVHVFDEITDATVSFDFYMPLSAEARDDTLEAIRQRLAERVARSGRPGVTSDILAGATAPAIVDAARNHHADLIVMGTHGRVGVAHMLLGSVAERVVRTAECPVLTIRASPAARATHAA